MTIKNILISGVLLLGILPILVGLILYVVFLLQPDNLWYRLMPATLFSQPSLNEKIVIISKKNQIDAWDFSNKSHYTFPDGNYYWLVLKENISIPNEGQSGGFGTFYAVNKDGAIYISSCQDEKGAWTCSNKNQVKKPSILWESISPEEIKKIEKTIENGTIIVENKETFDLMKKRLPRLKDSQHLLFKNAFISPNKKNIINSLNPKIIFRIASIIGWGISLISILILYLRKLDDYNIASIFLSLSIIVTLPVNLVMVFGKAGEEIFHTIYYVMWVISAVSVLLLVKYRETKIDYIVKNLKRRIWSNKLILLFLFLYLLGLYVSFLSNTLTTGDSARYVQGAMTIFEKGRWAMERIIPIAGHSSIVASYPPGPALLLAQSMWFADMQVEKMLFPGLETGTTLIIYAFMLALLQVSFVGSFLFFFRGLVKINKFLAMIFIVAMLSMIIPSLRGNPHAGETVMWPLFGNLFISLLLWKYTKKSLFLILAGLLSQAMLVIKPETIILFLTLGLSWVLWCNVNIKKYNPYIILLFCSFVLAPYLLWIIDKRLFNIQLGLYFPITFDLLLLNWHKYIEAISIVWRLSVTNVSLLPLLASFGVFIYIQIKKFQLVNFIVPIGILSYVFVILTTYVFSKYTQYPSMKTHILASWDRLNVYFILTFVLFTIDLWIISKGDKINKKV